MHGVRSMKPLFALTLLIGTSLVPVLHSAGIIHRAGAQETSCRNANLAPQSTVRGTGKPRKRRGGAATSGDRRSRSSPSRHGLGPGTRLRRDGTAARRDRDVERLARRTTETASVEPRADQDRPCAAVLPPSLCREMPLGAWCPLLPATFGVASRAAAMSAAPPAENTPPTESGNGPLKDESQ